jgi:hypothetical protein
VDTRHSLSYSSSTSDSHITLLPPGHA